MGWGSVRNFRRRSAPTIVHSSVVGIANACTADPDSMLVDLLTSTVHMTRGWLAATAPAPAAEIGDEQWQEICALTRN
jgi:hypothetical protein